MDSKNDKNEKIIYIKTQRGKTAIIYNNYKYKQKYISKNSITWVCTSDECNAKIKTDFKMNVVPYNQTEHKCITKTSSEIKKKIIKINEMRKLANNTCLNNSEIIFEVFKDLDPSNIAMFAKRRSLCKTINKKRNQNITNCSNTREIPDE
ncbi:hypothetical protein DMUE_4437 [Dictyocoela muelleri]|nr:hypothetical protein DMUE_4437 [Dictyocoela muelleri]